MKIKLPKITFSKMNWTRDCYKPSFSKYWSEKIWNFSIYKFSISIDFRGGFKITDLLTKKEKQEFFARLHKERKTLRKSINEV